MSKQPAPWFKSVDELLAAAREWHASLPSTQEARDALAVEEQKLTDVNAAGSLRGWKHLVKVASGLGVGADLRMLMTVMPVSLSLLLAALIVGHTEAFIWRYAPMLSLVLFSALLTLVVIMKSGRHQTLLDRQIDRRNKAERATWRPTDEDVMRDYLREKLEVCRDLFRPEAVLEALSELYGAMYRVIPIEIGITSKDLRRLKEAHRRSAFAMLDECHPNVAILLAAINARLDSLRISIFTRYPDESLTQRLQAFLGDINELLLVIQLAKAADRHPTIAAKVASPEYKELETWLKV